VEEEKVSNPLISGLAISTSVQDRLETIVKILLSRPILEQVVNELHLDAGAAGSSPQAFENLIVSLRNNISVQLISRDILKVTAENRDPLVCQKVANTITMLFIKHNLELQTRETNAGIEFLNNQKVIYEQKLRDSERALREFKEKYQHILSVKATQELSMLMGDKSDSAASAPAPLMNTEVLRYTQIKGDIVQLKLDLKDAINKKKQLLRQLESEGNYVITEKTIDPVIRGLEQDLAEKQVGLAKLQVDSTEEHPMVIRLKKEIEELKEAIKQKRSQKISTEDKLTLNPIYQNIKLELNMVDRDIESLKTRIKLNEIYLKEEADKIKDIPKKEEELANLQRDYSINATIYADLTRKLETAYITQRLELQEKGTKFKVVEPAKVPLRPFKPNRPFMSLAGATLGMIIGIGLIFFSEMTDHSFTEINQLRNFLDIPVVASISQILTIEEAEEIRARKKLRILMLFLFVLFSFIGGLLKYLIYKY